MAQLILTKEEIELPLWSDLEDDALGKLLRKEMISIHKASDQLDMTTRYAALLLLCSFVEEHQIHGIEWRVEGGKNNWKISLEKLDT